MMRDETGPAAPLDHPTRRRILRSLHRGAQGRSARELSMELGVGLSEIGYHVGVLSRLEMTTERGQRGSAEQALFESSVAGDPAIIAALGSTEAVDEGL